MENIVKLDKNELLNKLIEASGATMKIVVPISSLEDMKIKIVKIPEGFGQYVQCEIGDEAFNFVPEFASEVVSEELEMKKEPEPKLEEEPKKPKEKFEKEQKKEPMIKIRGNSVLILKALNDSPEGKTKKETAEAIGTKATNIYQSIETLKKNVLIEFGKSGKKGKKIKITEKGSLFLEEYEKKNGKVELPEKVVIQEQEKKKPEEIPESEINKKNDLGGKQEKVTLGEEEKLAKVQGMKMGEEIVSPETVAKELQISQEEAARLIEKSEAAI